jgi:uncharacterized protein YkwD
MKAFRVVFVVVIGGALGLVAMPFLPQSAQDWAAAHQNNVSSLADEVWTALRPSEDARTMPGINAPSATKIAVGTPIPVTAPSLTASSTTTPTSASRDTAQLEQLIHELVDKERQGWGMSSFFKDERLSAIARAHSQDMAETDYFAHQNSLGQGPSERAAQRYYICRKEFGRSYREGVSENISLNWLYSSITYVGPIPFKNYSSPQEIAASTVNGWMQSAGHRQNIMNPTFDSVGTGVAVSKDEKVYITQNFC